MYRRRPTSSLDGDLFSYSVHGAAMAFGYLLNLPLESPTLLMPALSSSYSTDCPTPPALETPFERVINISPGSSSRAPFSSQQYNSSHSYFPLMRTCPRRLDKPPQPAELYSALYNVLQGRWKEEADKLEGSKEDKEGRRKRSNSDGDVKMTAKKIKVEERIVMAEEAYESEDEETPFLFSVPDLPDDSGAILRRASLPTSSDRNLSNAPLLSYGPLPPPTIPPMNPFLKAFHFPASSLYIPPPQPSSIDTTSTTIIKQEEKVSSVGAVASGTSTARKEGLLSVVRGFEDLLKQRAELWEGLEGMKREYGVGR